MASRNPFGDHMQVAEVEMTIVPPTTDVTDVHRVNSFDDVSLLSPGTSSSSLEASSEASNDLLKQQKNAKIQNTAVQNFILGFADGSTVPFALSAGLSAAFDQKTVIAVGILELIAGCISMSGGAFLAATQERRQFLAEEQREKTRISTESHEAAYEIEVLMAGYGIDESAVWPMVSQLKHNPDSFLRFMMDFKHRLQEPVFGVAFLSAAVRGLAYAFASLLPMIPYFCTSDISHALYISIGIAVVEFSIFGFIKGYRTHKTRGSGLLGALTALLVGAIATCATYGAGKLISVV